jgi:hypothetical protein
MTDPMINWIGCLASVRAWRREASLIRELADRNHLPALRRQSLLREADAAEQQADSWLDAAMTTEATRTSKPRSPHSTTGK